MIRVIISCNSNNYYNTVEIFISPEYYSSVSGTMTSYTVEHV
jgi:hypothetical protein